MRVYFDEPIKSADVNLGMKADSLAMSRVLVDEAARRVAAAIERWQEKEKDPAASAEDRNASAYQIYVAQREFGFQWANVQRVLSEKST